MDTLNILWTTNNKETFFTMLSMYAINSKLNNWWKDVNIIIWGASAKLAGEDSQVQTEMIEMMHQGIRIEACRDCADNFNVTGILEKIGINVRYMGLPLTEYIKQDQKFLFI